MVKFHPLLQWRAVKSSCQIKNAETSDALIKWSQSQYQLVNCYNQHFHLH